jgi:hypothetical protein
VPDLAALEERVRGLTKEVSATSDILSKAVEERWLAEPQRALEMLAGLERALANLDASLDRFLDVLLTEKLAGKVRLMQRAKKPAPPDPDDDPGEGSSLLRLFRSTTR